MSTDETLRSWRDAAVAGGLPRPNRERWQPLRAGVVNLWEFEAVEYWYADGWIQLMGRNETGKSSLMALTTLIPWLADTSSDKIDTLGRSGKQFSYYVKPTVNDGDRRDASASFFHGWLWVEYGRIVDGEPRFFTTLLYASARSATPRVNLEWCTAHDARVRDGIQLTKGREVQTAKNIDVPGFTQHPSALSYKTELAEQLLGSTVDKLEIIGKILKVTRTPKLGAQLDVRFVTDHLRSSLPELRRWEIEQLAKGWDQLDQIRHDLQRTIDAAQTVARLAGTQWRAWLGARLRLAADHAADRRTKFDRVRRDEETARTTLAEAQSAVADLKTREGEARLTAEAASRAADELRESTAYAKAQGRIEAARRADAELVAAAKRQDEAACNLSRARRGTEAAARDDDAQRDDVEERRATMSRSRDAVREAADEAGLPAAGDVDAERLLQQITERRRDVVGARKLRRAADDADNVATRREEAAAVREETARQLETAAEQTWQEAEAEHEAVAVALSAWSSDIEPGSEIAAWLDGLPKSIDDLDAPTLTECIRADWYEPKRTNLNERRRVAEEASRRARHDAQRLTDEIEALELSGALPPPESALWRRRAREEVPGAPFWRLVDPTGIDDAELANVEAALAAAGLLDAWVDPTGVDGLDTFATTPDEAGAGLRLSAVLRVAEDAGELAEPMQNIVDGVVLLAAGEELPPAGLAIARDGRWRNSGLRGKAASASGQVEWLGEAAREARRRRRLAERRRERTACEEEAERHETNAASAAESLDVLKATFTRAPSDIPLRRKLDLAADRQRTAEKAGADAEAAVEKGRDARAAADARHSEFLRFVEGVRLPAHDEGLRSVENALHGVDRSLERLRHARDRLAEAERRAEQTATRRAEAENEEQEREASHGDAQRALSGAQRSAEELRASIGADDSWILARLQELLMEADRASRERESLANDRVEQSVRLGSAEERLKNLLSDREVATKERDAAFAEFRTLVDRGVVKDLALELPEVGSSAIEHVRAQVAEVRRAVKPRRWEDGPDRATSNEQKLQSLRSVLEARAREVNVELEEGGRALKLEPADDLIHIEVTVNSNGKILPLGEAVEYLGSTVATLQNAYDARVQETLDELLGSTFLEHMQERIGAATTLMRDINKVLADHSTTTSGTAMRIRLEPGQHRAVLDAVSGSGLLDPAVQAEIREFLRQRVDEARRQALNEGQADWQDTLAKQLDYRDWYDIALERRIGTGGSWSPLTARSFSEMSGGARAVMLMLPLVATLAALYRDLPDAPRPIWLDEAFDGLDVANRSMVMKLLRQFDLDVLLAGPGRLVNVQAVTTAAIYQVVRAPAPLPGADLTLELWAGGSLEAIDLPLTWLEVADSEAPDEQESLL